MDEAKKVSLKDVLNYEATTYISEEDMSLLRNTFGGNPKLIRVLQKLLLPSVGDPEMPIEEIQQDVWLYGVDWATVPADEAKPLILGRQLAIKFISGGLIKLKVLANAKQETPTEAQQRKLKDSSK